MKLKLPRDQLLIEEWVSYLINYYCFDGRFPLKALQPREQLLIAWLIWDYGKERRLHYFYTKDGRPVYSYHYGELDGWFGRGRFMEIIEETGLFKVYGHKFKEDGKGHTRGYELDEVATNCLSKFMATHFRKSLCLIDLHGKKIRKLPPAISSKNSSGATNKLWRGVHVLNAIPVAQELIHAVIKHYRKIWAGDDLFQQTPNRERVSRIIRDASSELIMALSCPVPNSIPIHYVESPSGRLYAQGTNLQTCTREVRKSLLAGNWDIDIDNCHYALLAQLYEKTFGERSEILLDYVRNTKTTRQRIADETGIPLVNVKKGLLMMVYNAPRSTSPKCSLAMSCGDKKNTEKLLANPLFSLIEKETRKLSKRIAKHAKANAKSGSIMNFAKCGLKLKDKPDTGQILAHLLQGIEAVLLKESVRHLQARSSQILLLQHDGLTVTKPIDVDGLSKHLFEVTGYEVTFKQELLQPPMGCE